MFKLLTFIVLGYWAYKVFFNTKKIEERNPPPPKKKKETPHIIDIDYEEVD